MKAKSQKLRLNLTNYGYALANVLAILVLIILQSIVNIKFKYIHLNI